MMKLELRNNVQKTVCVGVMAALLAVLSQISLPLPSGIPVTLQTFAVALCGCVLGPAMGTLAVAVYLALGAVGVPVLAGFGGGFGSFLGVTGGYLWGFLPLALLCGLAALSKNRGIAAGLGMAGLALCHIFGVIQFGLVMAVPLLEAFLIASAPYLLKDILSVVLAYFAAMAIIASLKKAGRGGVV